MKKAVIILVMILVMTILSSGTVLSAQISGTIYDIKLEELSNVVVEVNSTPEQRYVSKDGSYMFDLEPGTYKITARYERQEYRTLKSVDTLKVNGKGEYVFDLFLFSDLDEELELMDIEDIDFSEPVEPTNQVQTIGVTAVVTAAIILAIVVAYAYWYRRKMQHEEMKQINRSVRDARKRAKEHPADTKVEKVLEEMELREKLEKDEKLASDTEIIIEILRKEGGRATQKEIRKHIPLSEAKICLMIAELEHHGKVKKVKKGRGNIIILK